MNKVLLSLLLVLIAGCATSDPKPRFAQPRSILPAEYNSPDSLLTLRLRVGERRSQYELIERSSGARRATAESLITADDFHEGRFRGTQDVTFAGDGSGLAITEDVSDAGPALRHILFSRQSDGLVFARYLHPPPRRWTNDPRAEFDSELPIITALSRHHVALYYRSLDRTVTLPISDIPRSSNPKAN